MIAFMKNESNRKMMVWGFIGLALVLVVMSGCNTVRGVAKDVEKAADALDPDSGG